MTTITAAPYNLRWQQYGISYWITDSARIYAKALTEAEDSRLAVGNFIAYTYKNPSIVYAVITAPKDHPYALDLTLLKFAAIGSETLNKLDKEFIMTLGPSHKDMERPTEERVPAQLVMPPVDVQTKLPDPMYSAKLEFLSLVMDQREHILDHVLTGRDTPHNRSLADFTHQLATSAVLEILDGGNDWDGPGYLVLPANMVRNFEDTPNIAGRLTEVFDSYFEDINS